MTSNHEGSSGPRKPPAAVPLRPEFARAAPLDRKVVAVPESVALVVAGMHRSGTSAVTRVLSLCGLELPRFLMPANAANADGYWESEIVCDANDEVLRRLSSGWDDPFAFRTLKRNQWSRADVAVIKAAIEDQFSRESNIVVKDPRISMLLGPWRQALTELGLDARFVIPVRHPLEVIASLSKRDGFPAIKSALMWLSHLISVERDSRELQRVFVAYDDVLRDWRATVRRIEWRLDTRLPRWNDEAEIAIDRFLSSERRHHRFADDELQARTDLPPWMARAYDWALMAAREDHEPDPSALDKIAGEFESAGDLYAPLVAFEKHRAGPQETATQDNAEELRTTVYVRAEDAPFSEANSTHRTVALTSNPRLFTLPTPDSTRPPSAIRLDPADAEGQIRILGLRLRNADGDVAWSWDGKLDLFENASGIRAHAGSGDGVLLEFTDNDPQLQLPLPSGADVRAVEITATRASAEDVATLFERRRDARLQELLERLNSITARQGAIEESLTKVGDTLKKNSNDVGADLEARLAARDTAIVAETRKLVATEVAKVREEMPSLVRGAVANAIAPELARVSQVAERAFSAASRAVTIVETGLAKLTDAAVTRTNELAMREETLQNELASAAQAAQRWEAEARALRESTSWRLTAPLRALRRPIASLKPAARTVRAAARKMLAGRPKPLPTVEPPEPNSDAAFLAKSSLFDPAWYLAKYPDVAKAGVDPLQHYLHHGAFEGRDPGPRFDSRWYLAQNTDVHAAGMNPLVHYLRAGRRERRAPLPPRDQAPIRVHLTRLGTIQHWKHLISVAALRFEFVLPLALARKFGRHALIDLPAKRLATSAGGGQLFDQLFASATARGGEYVPLTKLTGNLHSRIRAIAFYLPQFHPIPENDAWWGKGFTEWTNVSKAVPQFVSHYQPRLPDELGFYDLRLPEVQRRQVELAKLYGIGGFCFHYYWFSGRRRLLERPLNQFLAAQDIDFPFCVCWANENWTRRWDGLDQQILMEQRHEPDDDLAFIEDLAPVLRDKRYIRVDGRPLIVVYRAGVLPNPRRTTQVWRDYCRHHDIGEPYLVAAQTFGLEDPRSLGFDAAVEFPPHKLNTSEINSELHVLNPDYQGRAFSYEAVARQEAEVAWPDYALFKTVMPSWDNEARKPGRGHAFVGATPDLFRQWFQSICHATDERYPAGRKFVFINAWNEWAEGAYLEPDRRFGYAYLQAARDVLSDFPAEAKVTRRDWPPLYVIVHAYYPQVFQEILDHLMNAPVQPHLVVTCPREHVNAVNDAIEQSDLTCQITVIEVENRGRDVLAFLEALRQVSMPPNALILKVHTKVTNHRLDGSDWRRSMLDSLMSPTVMERVLSAFADQGRLSLVAPGGYIVPLKTFIGESQPHIDALLRRGGWAPTQADQDVFAAGTMFYVRRHALDPVLKLNLEPSMFEAEAGQKDGTLAHALERLLTMVVLREGGEISDTGALLESRPWTANDEFDFAVKTTYLYKGA